MGGRGTPFPSRRSRLLARPRHRAPEPPPPPSEDPPPPQPTQPPQPPQRPVVQPSAPVQAVRPTPDRRRGIVLALSLVCAALLIAAPLAIFFSGFPSGGSLDDDPGQVYQGPEGEGSVPGGVAPL